MRTSKDPRILPYEESVDLLSKYGIPVAKGKVVTSPDEAIEIANEIGYPVALKVISPQLSHKTDAKALRLNLKTRSELAKSYHEVTENAKKYNPKAKIQGILIQEMIRNGVEVILGISRDPQFGPVILFGLGGIFVEVLKDVSLRVPPITRHDAEEMVKEIRGYKILEGFRGTKHDVEAIVDILLKVSRLSIDLRETISEMDLNPIIVQAEGKGAMVVDIRLVTL